MSIQKNVLEYLENSVNQNPGKIAFTDENMQISFLEFKHEAELLGTMIAKNINNINSPVAVLVDRNVESLIAFFGILYSGNFYVPIDNSMPKQRMDKVFEQLNPCLILYNEQDKNLASGFMEKYKVMPITDRKNYEVDLKLLDTRRGKILDIDPVYIIFTSGSTGVPKGIVISHRSVIDFTEWIVDTCGFSSDDIMGNQTPFYFDASVKDIYITMKCGATAHILSKKLFMFPIMLIDYLNKKNVTALVWATSAFNLIANSKILLQSKIESLKKVVLGGEALLAKHLNAWKEAMPYVKYINLYGPTEVTVDCSYFVVDRDFKDYEAVPIGKACENKEIMLLDENLKLVPDGEPGEICVRGIGVAKGYYNDKEKTDAVFIQNPYNSCYPDIIYRTGDIGVKNEEGQIVFQSRKDGQIKHMGYRIELGEIERAINSFEKIKAAICFFDQENDRIVCTYEGDTDSAEIIMHIKDIIPKYMYPNIFKKVENMPYNANGKIDRPKLRESYFNGANN
jgi:amino acid adenylation domain-containing protein